jgi:Ala-tRNA(Pro) deacylase
MSNVTEYLRAHDIPFEVIPHPPTATAVGEAFAVGVPAQEVAKAVLLDGQVGHLLAVIPASRRLDMQLVAHAVGEPHVRLATEEELQSDYPDYELGALPPLGELLHVPMYVDPEVVEQESMVMAGGTRAESIRVRTEDLLKAEHVHQAPLARHPEDDEEKEFVKG